MYTSAGMKPSYIYTYSRLQMVRWIFTRRVRNLVVTHIEVIVGHVLHVIHKCASHYAQLVPTHCYGMSVGTGVDL